VEQTQSFGPILILLVLIVSFLYMHFTNGSGLTRIYLAGGIVLAAILILLPSLNVDLPDWFKAGFGATKIQLGLDLQGGTHLLMAVKLDEAVKTQLHRRGDDLKQELKANKIDFADVSVDAAGSLTGIAMSLLCYGPAVVLWAAILFFPARYAWRRLR